MTTPLFHADIPSHLTSLLISLIGRKLIQMVRFNSNSIIYLTNIYRLSPCDFFSLCEGSILFYFDDGLVMGGSSDPSINSVLLWVEKNEIGEVQETKLEEWEEALPFYSKDFIEWKRFSGKVVQSVCILKEHDEENDGITNLPNERGVLLNFEDGLSLILSHGLNNNSDDTSIITPNKIDTSFENKLMRLKIKPYFQAA